MTAGDALGTGVRRFSTIRAVAEQLGTALDDVPDWALTIGGDCSVTVAAIAHAARRTGGDLAVLWIDAHPDLHAPDSSPSGAFGGMTLRAVMGDGAEGLALDEATRVAPERIVLAGARDIDGAEAVLIDELGIRHCSVDDLADPQTVLDALTATEASHVYVHIDLDVLDPATMTGVSYPIPFGIEPDALTALLTAVVARVPIAGATIAGFAPSRPDTAINDLPTILRIIGATTSRA